MEKCILDTIVMENTNTTKCLIININNIDHLKWSDHDYISNICKLDIYKYIDMNADNFTSIINENLYYDFIDDIRIDKQIIYEESEYVYELLYINSTLENIDIKKNYMNGLATLLNTNQDEKEIYFNCILLKTHIPLNSDSILFHDISIKDIENILFYRANKKIITYDEDYKEEILFGDIEAYGKTFFNEEYYVKKEIKFLHYNLNLWFTTSEYGEPYICGKLILNTIDKCIIFIKNDESNLGHITMDEFNKIIFLSDKMDNYTVPNEYYEDKIDKYNRKIIYNKYKILNLLYHKYL